MNVEHSLMRRFRKYHQDNPGVYDLFKRFAHESRDSGLKRFSADAILHRIRWYVAVETKGSFKVNNIASAFYARMLVDEDPSFAGFFEMRKARADEAVV